MIPTSLLKQAAVLGLTGAVLSPMPPLSLDIRRPRQRPKRAPIDSTSAAAFGPGVAGRSPAAAEDALRPDDAALSERLVLHRRIARVVVRRGRQAGDGSPAERDETARVLRSLRQSGRMRFRSQARALAALVRTVGAGASARSRVPHPLLLHARWRARAPNVSSYRRRPARRRSTASPPVRTTRSNTTIRIMPTSRPVLFAAGPASTGTCVAISSKWCTTRSAWSCS